MTPAEYERSRSGQTVEQVIRPTGLLDPEVEVRPIDGQIDDLIGEINQRTAKEERVLVTTLTKKMAEDLTIYLQIFFRSLESPAFIYFHILYIFLISVQKRLNS